MTSYYLKNFSSQWRGLPQNPPRHVQKASPVRVPGRGPGTAAAASVAANHPGLDPAPEPENFDRAGSPDDRGWRRRRREEGGDVSRRNGEWIVSLIFLAVVVAQVVAHQTTDWEVLGSIPARSRVFFSTVSYQKCVLNKVPRGGATQLIFLHKMLSCTAWGETSLIGKVIAKKFDLLCRGRSSSVSEVSWIKVLQKEVQLNWHEFNSWLRHRR